uniref:G_PROTEIN_RECEP_F1_2 domain-containing protein n=1 Tax=Panagrellus redivivus TaxID=6233 RepID=A0A7E4VBP8_PANRE
MLLPQKYVVNFGFFSLIASGDVWNVLTGISIVFTIFVYTDSVLNTVVQTYFAMYASIHEVPNTLKKYFFTGLVTSSLLCCSIYFTVAIMHCDKPDVITNTLQQKFPYNLAIIKLSRNPMHIVGLQSHIEIFVAVGAVSLVWMIVRFVILSVFIYYLWKNNKDNRLQSTTKQRIRSALTFAAAQLVCCLVFFAIPAIFTAVMFGTTVTFYGQLFVQQCMYLVLIVYPILNTFCAFLFVKPYRQVLCSCRNRSKGVSIVIAQRLLNS